MEIIEINQSNLNNTINELFDMQKDGNYVFRGYSKANELLPSLVRNYDRLNLDDYGMLKYEKMLLKQYGKYAIQYLPYYFTPLDWVASAQHFGLPTRLIDWSFDPFCSLYFALSLNKKPEEEYYKLIAVDLREQIYFNEIPVFTVDATHNNSTNNAMLDNYLLFVNSLLTYSGCLSKTQNEKTKREFCNKMSKHFEDEVKTQKHKLFFCSIYDSNPRIIAQKGLFQIPRRFVDDEGNDIIDKDIISASQRLYKISKSIRGEILDILDKLNISTPRLFPDLQNICTYLKNIEPSKID